MLLKTAEYALRVVACLSREKQQAERADALAEETNVPSHYLNKVLKDLVDADLITSRARASANIG